VRERIGKDKKVAKRALAKYQAQEDEGSFEVVKNIKFADWGDEWLDGLEKPKAGTVEGYRSTIEWAKQLFGHKNVRQISVSDIKNLNRAMREAKLSGSTRAKHLRVLSGCLQSAVAAGFAKTNVVAKLPQNERPTKSEHGETNEAPYFLDAELLRLFREIPEGLYRTLFTVAVRTGMRFGELAALVWGDIDWTDRTIHVARSYRQGRISSTKNRKRRDVPVTWDTLELLQQWSDECGNPEDDILVFPGGRSDGFLDNATVGRVLHAAMDRAGIPRECPEGRARELKRNVHSLRHTFAKRALEGGRSLFWLSRYLGHSDTSVTDKVYGHLEADRSRQEVDELTHIV
jgi:integrase